MKKQLLTGSVCTLLGWPGAVLLAGQAHADSYTITNIDVPGAAYTHARGINNAGQVTGFYNVAYATRTLSFVDSNGAFTTLDAPNQAYSISALGISNSGQLVGSTDYHNNTPAFLINGSDVYTTFLAPGSGWGTFASGINDSGLITGYYLDGHVTPVSFLDDNGTFSTIVVPGSDTNTTLPLPSTMPDRSPATTKTPLVTTTMPS